MKAAVPFNFSRRSAATDGRQEATDSDSAGRRKIPLFPFSTGEMLMWPHMNDMLNECDDYKSDNLKRRRVNCFSSRISVIGSCGDMAFYIYIYVELSMEERRLSSYGLKSMSQSRRTGVM